MERCKVIELFKVSWGTVVVLDFYKPTSITLGDRLKDSSESIWKITGIAKRKLPAIDKYQGLIDSVYVWDCTIEPISHKSLPKLGEELYFIKEY